MEQKYCVTRRGIDVLAPVLMYMSRYFDSLRFSERLLLLGLDSFTLRLAAGVGGSAK